MHLKVFDDIRNATQRLSDASRRLPERFVDGCFGQPNFYRQNSPSRCFIKKKYSSWTRQRARTQSQKILKLTSCVQTFINYKQNSEKWTSLHLQKKPRLLFSPPSRPSSLSILLWRNKGMRKMMDQSSARDLGGLERTKDKEDNIWKSFYCGCF